MFEAHQNNPKTTPPADVTAPDLPGRIVTILVKISAAHNGQVFKAVCA
jgi:hypothetical protein